MTQGRDFERDRDRPIEGLAGLRHVTPPASLVARVMTSVAAPGPVGWRRGLARLLRAEVRVSLPAILLVALAAGVSGWLLRPEAGPTGEAKRAAAPAPAATEVGATPVLVRFVFEDRRAHQVFVAGSFNDWSPTALSREDTSDAGDGVFVATLALPRGVHEYMFRVDGRWVPDPLASDSRPDGFGRRNSVLRL